MEVPSADFQQRINQFRSEENRSPSASILSRLALIHQVAKAYATEASRLTSSTSQTIDIEEITDPPMYDLDRPEGIVIIQYSYDED